jgi:hypothetical protein
MKKRLANPVFLLAVAGLLYQFVTRYMPNLQYDTFKLIVDTVTYIVIGTGIYSTFEVKE